MQLNGEPHVVAVTTATLAGHSVILGSVGRDSANVATAAFWALHW